MGKQTMLGTRNYTNFTTSLRNTSDSLSSADWKPFDEAAAAISFLLFIVIVILNGLVIFILKFKAHKKSRLFYFVLNLAIADLLVGIVNVLGDGIRSAMYGEWHGGDVVCRVWRFSKIVALMVSSNILIGMSIDRFLAIRYPLNSVRIGAWRHLNKILVISAWVVSIIVASFVLKYSKGINADPDAVKFIDQKGACDLTFPDDWWKPYVVMVAVGVYIMPTIVITVCYIGICIVIWNNWRAGTKLTETNKPHSHGISTHTGDTGLLPKAKVKSIKMTIVICIAFFVCWTPYFIVIILDVYDYSHMDDRYRMLMGMLYPLNSACNPLIFILFNLKLFQRHQDGGVATSYGCVTKMNTIGHATMD